jgi:transposase
MGKQTSKKSASTGNRNRRRYSAEFREEAVQMVLDGHSVTSVAERLGLSSPQLLHSWKRKLIGQGGKTTRVLDGRLQEVEKELRRVQTERDILKKALAIFGRER